MVLELQKVNLTLHAFNFNKDSTNMEEKIYHLILKCYLKKLLLFKDIYGESNYRPLQYLSFRTKNIVNIFLELALAMDFDKIEILLSYYPGNLFFKNIC